MILRATSSHRSDGALATASLLGTLDVASFLLTRRQVIFRESLGRALGSVTGLVLWSSLAGAGWAERRGRGKRLLGGVVTYLAVACGAGNLALMVVHFKVGKGRGRALLGGSLGAIALTSALDRISGA
ncbi:MAG: hypothetical protein ACYCX9_01720 [Candidatus Dormibacteria bacterium]|jgi:hypothetical protein